MRWRDVQRNLEMLVRAHEARERQAAHASAAKAAALLIADKALEDATASLRVAEWEWLSQIQQPTLAITLAHSWANAVRLRRDELAAASEDRSIKDREKGQAFQAWQIRDAELIQARRIHERALKLRLKARERIAHEGLEDRLGWMAFR